ILGIGNSPHLLGGPQCVRFMFTKPTLGRTPRSLPTASESLSSLPSFPQPICEHMTESLDCSQTSNLVCGTDGVTYESECQLCLTRLKTKQDIQIVKDGKC
uniref:Serine peptidase inhibitor Kazal type 4 n=1 Tax=Propithecus coquereli TaxID=379532 RepID=A0A2K6FSF3_PROCO